MCPRTSPPGGTRRSRPRPVAARPRTPRVRWPQREPARLSGAWSGTGPPLAAAAVLAVALVAGLLLARPAVPGPDRLPSLERVDLVATGRAALGATDAGELADPARRAACLAVVAPPGVRPDAPFLGGRRVDLDGRQGVLLALASGELGRFHVVVVDPGCGPAGGQLLGWEVIGR